MTVCSVVSPSEWLSRYILHSSHIRRNQTVKPDSFIPHPYPDLSVTRNLELSDKAIWDSGKRVAAVTDKVLYGRAENKADDYTSQHLKVLSDPTPDNPNHANVTGWPGEKPAQKMVALLIAAKSKYIPVEE